MKHSRIAIALGLLCTGTGNAAMFHSPEGRGQVLLFPYYTVNDNVQTLVSVVNSTGHGKAIAVRFREGSNSREVLGFHLYLGPYDVWTAALFATGDAGPAHLVTADQSCTVPPIRNSTSLPTLANGSRYVAFRNYLYTGSENDSGSNDLARTREGHFELIEMGEVLDTTRQTLRAITPGATGIPYDCGQVVNAWTTALGAGPAYWALGNPDTDIAVPGGGLYGYASLVRVLDGTMIAYPADAIGDFSSVRQHRAPLSPIPNLGTGVSAHADGMVEAFVFPGDSDAYLRFPPERAIDAVSAVLTADAVYNDFVTGAQIGAASEWVVSFPTKHFYTDFSNGPAIAPFEEIYPTIGNLGVAPVHTHVEYWDRDGQVHDCREGSPIWCPGLPPPMPDPLVTLNWAVNVISFNQADTGPSRILGSRLSHKAPINTAEGSVRLSLHRPDRGIFHQLRADVTANRRMQGLPVLGFWAVNYTNGSVTPGILANYAGATPHQVTRSVSP